MDEPDYFSALTEGVDPHDNEKLPSYVRMILSGHMSELGEKATLAVINQNELRAFRVVWAITLD